MSLGRPVKEPAVVHERSQPVRTSALASPRGTSALASPRAPPSTETYFSATAAKGYLAETTAPDSSETAWQRTSDGSMPASGHTTPRRPGHTTPRPYYPAKVCDGSPHVAGRAVYRLDEVGSRTPRTATPTLRVGSSSRSVTPTPCDNRSPRMVVRSPILAGPVSPRFQAVSVPTTVTTAPTRRPLSPPRLRVPTSVPTTVTTSRGCVTPPMLVPPMVAPHILPSPRSSLRASITPPRTTITPPRSPRNTLTRAVATTVVPALAMSPRPLATTVLPTTVVKHAPKSPRTSLRPVTTLTSHSVPTTATVQTTVIGDTIDKVGTAVVTAWTEMAPQGYPYQNRLTTPLGPRVPLLSPTTPETGLTRECDQLLERLRLDQTVESNYTQRACAQFGGTGLQWDDPSASVTISMSPTKSGGASGSYAAEANAIDAILSGSPQSNQRQARSPTTASPKRYEALEAHCFELERKLVAKDDQLQEFHESIQRTVRELERKERQVEEERLHNAALTQQLTESALETAAANQRVQELEAEVRRMEKYRDERERRRQGDGLDRPENSSELSDFDRAVRDVNIARGSPQAGVAGTSPRANQARPSGASRVRSSSVDLEARLRHVFETIDKNGDGMLSRTDIILALRKHPSLANLMHLPMNAHQEDGTRDKFERVFQTMDGDINKHLDWHEFLEYFKMLERAAEQVPVVEANLTSDMGPVGEYRDLPTLASLRHRLYDHKEAQRDGILNSPDTAGSSTSRRASAPAVRPRVGSTASSTMSASQRRGSDATASQGGSPTSTRRSSNKPAAQEKLWR